MKKIIGVLILLLAMCLPMVAGIPEKPVPARFVCDYAGILDRQRAEDLNNYLQTQSDTTTNQVVVVTIADLEDYDPADYAQRLGQKWGVGTAEKSNGVVILLKPRNEHGGGKVEISTGYGAEGALTDVMCGHIIDTEMMPYLQQGDYTGAAEAGAKACIVRLNGEYTGEWEEDDTELVATFIMLAALILLIYLIIIKSREKGKGSGGNRHHDDFFPPIYPGGGRSRGSSSGGFSMPSHSGFGGGSFGGGGAGRSF